MGQSLQKLTAGSDEKKANEIGPIIVSCYDKHFGKAKNGKTAAVSISKADFYQVVCETVQEINEKFGNTQFRIPESESLKKAYEAHHTGMGELTREESQNIIRDLIRGTGFTGSGAKDVLLYIFGVPAVTLFVKQLVVPRAIPNAIFIPGVTSGTVFLLAKLHKL
ncbi:uncharacterized protein LOC131143498 [Malania oleifera]|uniref:uncharacterized protein LOC131143498 n=1 Tax=Malania oleifera TaxID=397392 RepID=UPI0025AE2C92|nr:uncharacterized protein LOC131143498 [Malania oleifera]